MSKEYLKAPTHLSKEEKKEWHRVVKSQPAGYFNDGHTDLLISYVSASIMLAETRTALSSEGYFSEGSQGQIIQHPAVRMQAEAIKLLNTLATRLAIDPASQKAAAGPAHAQGVGPNSQKGAFAGLVE